MRKKFKGENLMLYTTFEHQGYAFTFLNTYAKSESGIVLHPDDHIDERMLSALHYAQKAYVEWQNLPFARSPINYARSSTSELIEQQAYLNNCLQPSYYRLRDIERDELENMLRDVEEVLSGRKNYIDPKTVKPHQSTSPSGYVYLLQSPTSAYKIGRTKNPKNRRLTFGVKLPFEVEFVCLIETLDMYELERSLHLRFESKRVNGEWFELETEDVEYIKSLAVES